MAVSTEPAPAMSGAVYRTGTVTAKDGVALGYRRMGTGPGLVLVHGAMELAESHMQLAEALAGAFTVYLPDRRGRGLSGPFGPDAGIRANIYDLGVLLAATGARHVFGVSSGAVITLSAALTLPGIARIALYEPPLSLSRAAATAILTRYDREMAAGRVAAALVTSMKGAQMGPPIFNLIPRPLLVGLTSMGMAAEARKAAPGAVTMQALAPTLHDDFALIAEASEGLERFRAVRIPVLLLGGDKSPAYLRASLDALQRILPHAARVTFPGLGHGGSGNRDRGGRPEVVAPVLHRFFGAEEAPADAKH